MQAAITAITAGHPSDAIREALTMRMSTFKSLPAIVAIAALTTVAGCSDNTSPSPQYAGGSYALQSVNAINVPYTYNSGSSTITIQSDVYTLNDDGTYSESINETISNGFSSSPASDAEAGSWYQNGNAMVFKPTYSTQGNYSQYTGALSQSSAFSHSSITFSYNGVVWVYNHT